MNYIDEALEQEKSLNEMATPLKKAREKAMNQSLPFMQHVACFLATYIKKDINMKDIPHYESKSQKIFIDVVTTKVNTKAGVLSVKDIYNLFLDGHVMKLVIENIDKEHKPVFLNVNIDYISILYDTFKDTLKEKLEQKIIAIDAFNKSLEKIKDTIDNNEHNVQKSNTL